MKHSTALLVLGLVIVGNSLMAADKKIDLSKLDLSKLPPLAAKKGVTYAKDIRPLFETSCFRCHGDERQKGELRLDSLEAVLKGGEDGKVALPATARKVCSSSPSRRSTTISPCRPNPGPVERVASFAADPVVVDPAIVPEDLAVRAARVVPVDRAVLADSVLLPNHSLRSRWD